MNKLLGLLFLFLVVVIYAAGAPANTTQPGPAFAPSSQPIATASATPTSPPRPVAVNAPGSPGLSVPALPPSTATPSDSPDTVGKLARGAVNFFSAWAEMERAVAGWVDGAGEGLRALLGFAMALRDALSVIGLALVLKFLGVWGKLGS